MNPRQVEQLAKLSPEELCQVGEKSEIVALRILQPDFIHKLGNSLLYRLGKAHKSVAIEIMKNHLWRLSPVQFEELFQIDDIPLLTQEQLKLYFKRIHADPKTIDNLPPLDALAEIHRRQVMHVHVSNLGMQDKTRENLKWPISPFFDDIFKKIVVEGGHGYCLENNLLLRQVLLTLKFKVNFCLANIMRDGVTKGDPTHAFMMVEINGKQYLVDAGYGGIAPLAVSEFKLDEAQTGAGKPWTTTGTALNFPYNLYKFTKAVYKFNGRDEERSYQLWHYYHKPDSKENAWEPLYLFRLKNVRFHEVFMANYRVSQDMETSPFKTRVFETAFVGNGCMRMALTQNEFIIWAFGVIVYWKPVKNQDQYNNYLVKYLGHTPEQLRPIRDRVQFNHPSPACAQWYSLYKKNKQQSITTTIQHGADKKSEPPQRTKLPY